jgi:uncharacterized protein YigA (DUF484 family)
MRQQKVEVATQGGITEDEIVEYLRSHPDFFERHERVLLSLRVPHAGVHSSVSLVERQVAVLRDRNDQLESRLKNLIAVAKSNEVVVEKLHQLALQFLTADSTVAILERLETALREDFAADRATVVVYRGRLRQDFPAGGLAKIFDADDPALQPFATFTKSARVRCGRLRARQREVLFGIDDEALGSAAMVPLGEHCDLGFLVICNRDADYFNPAKRTDFLARLGEMVTVALDREL